MDNIMSDKEIRKIAVTGQYDTYYITLPKKMVRSLNWRKGEKKVVEQRGAEIVIKDWVPS